MRRRLLGIIKGFGLLLVALIILLTIISIMPMISERYDKYVQGRQERSMQVSEAKRSVDGKADANESAAGKAHIETATIVSDGVVTVDDGQAGMYVRSKDNYILTVLLNGEEVTDMPVALSSYESLERGATVMIEHFHEGWYKDKAKLLPAGSVD